jgi:ribonuclease BN (tRNA processing enzyme)
MILTVLGAGPAYTDRPDSSGAAYLVQAAGTTILLDLGQGSFPRLAAAIEPSRLDAVVVSHLHPDHFIDLVPLRHYLAYQFRPPRHVRVIAPAGLAERIDALHARPGFTSETLDVESFDAERASDRRTIGNVALEARRVAHTGDSHAVRLAVDQEAPGLVYSGDCGRADDLAPLIRAGDTLLVEVSFGVGPVPPDSLHLAAPAIADLVRATRPGRVLLTHLQMGFDGGAAVEIVQAATTSRVTLVAPGDRYSIADTDEGHDGHDGPARTSGAGRRLDDRLQ